MAETRSTCPYCGVGCGVIIESRGAQITGVRGEPAHPANFGRLCTKGSTLHLTASAAITRQARLLQPMRRAARGEAPVAIGWDEALGQAADRFAQTIATHGPDAVGFYLSGQLLTEDYYVFNKLAKGVIGTNNLDTNSRLCMSSAVAGYKQTLGADAPPACYDDLLHAQCVFITGSNAAWSHPVLFRRLEDARAANPAMKIVVVDPRRTDTADIADLHLQIQPGTDVLLCHGLLHLMLWEGWTDTAYIAAHTTGFDALKALVRDATPDAVAQACGIAQDDLLTAARWFALGGDRTPQARGATLSLYCMGLNQSSSGTAKNTALINLHLATGQIGKPGAGPFSLTGQPNAMGGREVGGLSNLMSAHRDMANPQHRAEVAALWGVPSVPATPGKSTLEMFQAAADGEIKALWIACTNPAQSIPDQALVRRALQRSEFVVVQEAFATAATCDFADLLLPAATWGEKDGTVTNSERRISRVRAAVPAAGDARSDWSIAAAFGQRLATRLGLGAHLLDYASAESVWNEHRDSTRGRDLDITGLSWTMLDAQGPQQWPLPEGAPAGRARLYEDGAFPTPDGRARFVATPYKPVAEPRDARYPFALTTGRLRDQWHGMTRTGTLGRLFAHVPEPVVQLHPQDMARRLLAEGALVHVTSRRGSIVLPVQGSDTVAPGQAFIAMHWGGEFLGGRTSAGDLVAGVNALTQPAYCPDSKQPELKHAAVKILKADLPWGMFGMAWLPEAEVQARRQQLRALMGEFAFATCVPFSDNRPLADGTPARHGLLFRAAAAEAVAPAVLRAIEGALGLKGDDTLRYADAKRQQHRAARMVRGADGGVTLDAVLLAGDTQAESWIRAVLHEGQPAQTYGRLVLAPGARPPVVLPTRGKAVCSCFGVSQSEIEGHLASCHGSDEERLASLQGALRCGTNCGSCVPELKRLVRQNLPLQEAA
ncbi:MAG: molybdopterin-dependent oxidoreductase [Burkholderiales bacterium]|nr:molybdopterin-dependent oxidoreductase [Burkholderiales bacterium]